jgi:hypothetical protein
MSDELNKALAEPIWDQFDENIYRIRRNLLIFSSSLVAIKLGELGVSSEKLFLGITLTGLTTNKLIGILVCITLYHLCHFGLAVWGYYLRWRIRVTGRHQYKVSQQSHMMWTNADSKLNQSTLYSWWLLKREEIAKILPIKEQIESIINATSPTHHPAGVDHSIKRLEDAFSNLTKFMEDERLESLKKFDDWFWLFQRSEKMRWMGIEVAFPLYLGILSLIWS